MIYPRCKSPDRQIFIGADGAVLPCCWMGSLPRLSDYKNLHKDHYEKLNIGYQGLDEILASSEFALIEKTWNTEKPLPCCVRYCSSPLTPKRKPQGGVNQAEILDL